MPRRPRLHVPGGLFHVILRGNGRQAIFFDPEDRQLWEGYLKVGLQRHAHRLHAYCWMTNHVHMAIQAHAAPLARFIGTLASQYARAINKKLGRSGHVFERRYRATLVQTDSYLLELVRYIHLNPVRADMAADPGGYRWSSHRAYMGATAPAWLTQAWVLGVFAESEPEARRSYARFMQEAPSESVASAIRSSVRHNEQVLGDDLFANSAERAVPSTSTATTLDEIVATACRRHSVTEAELSSRSLSRRHARIRAEIAIEADRLGVAGVTEVARRFGKTQPSLSRAVRLLREKTGCS